MDLENLPAAVTRRELYAAGYTSNDLQRAERKKIICRLAPGIFAPPAILDGPPEIRHRERAIATARGRDGVLSFVSAAAVHGLPVWGMPLDRVHLSRAPSSAGSMSTGVVMTHCDRRSPSVTEVKGAGVVSVARTVVDLARTERRVPAIVTGDAALHLGLCTMDELEAELSVAAGFPGYHAARRAIGHMNGLSESVLETRSRMLFVDAPDVPAPRLQLTVVDADGDFVARGDFGWEDERVIGECDGVGKYGEDPRRALLREKQRTDRLYEAGWQVVRWGWPDLEHPTRVLDRVRRMLRSRAA